MNRWLLATPMAIFGAGGIVLLLVFLYGGGEGPVHDSLIPELIGFCIEGFVLVGILSLAQHSREQARRREVWLSLRAALREFLSHLDVAFLTSNAEPTSAHALETDPEVVRRLIGQVEEIELDLEVMVRLKSIAERDLELTHDLIPVAAQLSAGHMSWWIAIVASVRKLSEATDRFQIDQALRGLLANLNEFDDLGY